MTTIALSAHIDSPWFTEQFSYWFTQLNEKEKQRYTLMKSKRKQQQMLLSRALIVKALTKFNCSLNSAYEIDNYSTLILFDNMQSFSISITHSGTMAAIILSDQSLKLGIDIERIKNRNFTELAAEICTKNELTLIYERDDIEADFYQLWTIKESLAKASQSSLTHLYQCDCSAALLNNIGKIHWNNLDYYFNHISIQGYKGAIVTNEAQTIIQYDELLINYA
jgi:phosphopantetheinyl transferase (holo-ACP synthase)